MEYKFCKKLDYTKPYHIHTQRDPITFFNLQIKE